MQNLPHQDIIHNFVDINQDEVVGLINQGRIQVCSELLNSWAEERDPFIANHAIEIFSRYREKNGLLICADRHFSGVTQYLKNFSQAEGSSLETDSLSAYPWYKAEEQISPAYGDEECHTCFTASLAPA
jgi:hypothetical protein